jgi:glycerophosphoryl diester phosphodiesterase
MKNDRTKIKIYAQWAAVALLIGMIMTIYANQNGSSAYRWLRDFDRIFLHEKFRDLRASLFYSEDWHSISPPIIAYDYNWLSQISDPDGVIRIAHGLGGVGTAANSLAALHLAQATGFRIFEVDLWLDQAGYVRCHHGPEVPPPLKKDSCIFERILNELRPHDFLILDIKTDFKKTFAKILELVPPHQAAQIITQIYTPEQITLFQQAQTQYKISGPIITLYQTHHSLNHIIQALQSGKSHIRVVVFPFERLPALQQPRLQSNESKITLFSHPVKDCDDLKLLLKNDIQGIYIKQDFPCLFSSSRTEHHQ